MTIFGSSLRRRKNTPTWPTRCTNGAGGAARQFVERGIAGVALADPRAHLDEFVVAERAVEFA